MQYSFASARRALVQTRQCWVGAIPPPAACSAFRTSSRLRAAAAEPDLPLAQRFTLVSRHVTGIGGMLSSYDSRYKQCFHDPVQQNQVTAQNGFYKFDLNFSDVSCPAGGAYLIEVTPPATGYLNTPSQIIPLPQDNTATTPFPVPACPGNALYDTLPATNDYCEAMASAAVPPPAVSPDNVNIIFQAERWRPCPAESNFQQFHSSRSGLNGAVAITKTSSLTEGKGTLVPTRSL
jgi:hypothetical protein